jgi:hypothetical protein|tara:strand:+ start:378 stop:713 length:336 start_codon:yes stop_codon:yes gene_type:complete
MKKSNIFAYIELSKLVEELNGIQESENLKQKLKSQSAYFSILESRYFSDPLVPIWEEIVNLTRKKEAIMDENGKLIINAINNTFDHYSNQDCKALTKKIHELFQKVEKEYL